MHFCVGEHVCVYVCTCLYMTEYMHECTCIEGHVNACTYIYVDEKLICVIVRVIARKNA